MLLGYMRVSSKTQDDKNGASRQRAILEKEGVEEENLFYDVITGTSAKRPALDKLLDFCRKGDTIVCSELSRLGRNTRNCLELIEKLTDKGVSVRFVKEGIDTNTDLGKFFLTVCSAFNELELSYIHERCQQGIEIAKQEGRMGRPKTDKDNLDKAMDLYQEGVLSVREITEETGVSSSVIYREKVKRGIMRES